MKLVVKYNSLKYAENIITIFFKTEYIQIKNLILKPFL